MGSKSQGSAWRIRQVRAGSRKFNNKALVTFVLHYEGMVVSILGYVAGTDCNGCIIVNAKRGTLPSGCRTRAFHVHPTVLRRV